MSMYTKHDEEVERLKKKYPNLSSLCWFVNCNCPFSGVIYVGIEEKTNINVRCEVSATTLSVINALEQIELRACETRETLLKEYLNEHTK